MAIKRTVTIALSVVFVLSLILLGLRALKAPGAEAALGYETAAARRGEIVATVNATGSIAPRSRAALTFSAAGRITEIQVSIGDKVQAGQALAAIDARDLQQAVAQAEAVLQMSKARLAQAKRGATPEDVAAAQANLTSAQEHLNLLRAGTPASDIEIARLRWEQAKDDLWKAQAQRDATCGNSDAPDYMKDQSKAAVASAEMAVEVARLQYEQVKGGPTSQEIKAAEAQVADAQSALTRLTNGTAPEEIQAAQAQVNQNKAALEQAKLRLEGAVLSAPFVGVVAGIHARVGEVTSMTNAAITLVDLDAFHIDVDIDEASIGQIQAGQKVEVALDAFPDKTITGQVVHVDPVGTLSQGVVNYAVTVQLDQTDAPLKADMTAGVNIITARKADVVLVPNRAVRRDRQGRYVEVIENGQIKRQNVEVGLSNEADTEVVKGLKEGTQVVVSAPRQSPYAPSSFEGR